MKKILILTTLILTLTIIFLACSEERDHSNPVDPDYWDADKSPSNLLVTGLGLTIAEISWTDNSIEEKFIIERKLFNDTEWSEIGEITGDNISGVNKTYTDNSLEAEKTYYYRIKAVNGDFESNSVQSYIFTSILPAPDNLTSIIVSETSITIYWTDNSVDEEGFTIDRMIGAEGIWVENYATIKADTVTFTDKDLITDTTYYYRVRAYYSTYFSNYTNEAFSIPVSNACFISIPTGSFSMGSTAMSDEQPIHTVNITRPFYLGKYEVTQKEWQTIMGSNPAIGYGVGNNYPVYLVSFYSILVYCNKKSITEGLTPCYSINGSTDPVDWGPIPEFYNSSWNSVVCNFSAKGYRLPTEAEWEYAARYNDGRTYPWGETAPSIALCNYDRNVEATTAVGSYPNGNSNFGLCDMAGNVWEWVWDWYASYPSTTQIDPSGPNAAPTTTQAYRVLRGGGFDGPFVFCSLRLDCGPQVNHYGCGDNGFRLARTK